MARRGLAALACAFLVTGCATGDTASQGDYRATVARALNHLQTAKPPTYYAITGPWTNLMGRMMVCARREVPDGRGGIVPTNDFSMFEFDNGRITSVMPENTGFGCVNRNYTPLAPV